MSEKENEPRSKGYSRRKRGKGNNTTIQEGNDFVLKRYRLEENQTFKDTNHEEFQYQNALQSKNKEENCDQWQDDLVIVPLDDPEEHNQQEQELQPVEVQQIQPVQTQELQPVKADQQLQQSQAEQTPQTIFVFDDDEEEYEEIKPVQKKEKVPDRNLLLQPTLSIKQQKKTSQNKQKKVKLTHLPQFNVKETSRSSTSTAELLTPKRTFSGLYNTQEDVSSSRNQYNLTKKQKIQDSQQDDEISLKKIKGVEIQSGTQNQINIVNKRVFSISKLPSGIILRCIIKRTNSFINRFYPQYDLYLANGLKHILSAKKYPMRNRQLFKFYTDPVKINDACLLSVMHANVNHNIYWMLHPPKKINNMDLAIVQSIIGYYRLKENENHRKFSVLLPSMNHTYQLALDYQQNFINFSNFKEEIKVQLNNLSQWENQSHNSTKNFVIADQEDPDYRYLQLKKESQNIFQLTIQHPLSPLQAMAVAMTRFDVQLK